MMRATHRDDTNRLRIGPRQVAVMRATHDQGKRDTK
jgi:hypothetical protein